jgi:hypothetical protein
LGFKGLIRDVIMFFVGLQLIFGAMDKSILGLILIVTAIIFTVIGFIVAFGGN